MAAAKEQSAATTAPKSPYVVHVPVGFLVLTLAVSVMVAFGVGQAARLFVTHGMDQMPFSGDEHAEKGVLPYPVMSKGKKVPRTLYTSKHFDTGKSVTSDSMMAREQLETANKEWVKCLDSDGEDNEDCHHEVTPSSSSSDDEAEEEEHMPAGQHLLVDIENMDGAFLNSKERLARAMMDLVDLSGLTMLSYHCHELQPAGVSCAGVLLESHVSFHTWPAQGVITLDLFTCGPASLVPYIPVVEKLFSIPRTPSYEGELIEPPHMLWSYKRRGFREQDAYDASAGDIYNQFLGVMEFENKTLVCCVSFALFVLYFREFYRALLNETSKLLDIIVIHNILLITVGASSFGLLVIGGILGNRIPTSGNF